MMVSWYKIWALGFFFPPYTLLTVLSHQTFTFLKHPLSFPDDLVFFPYLYTPPYPLVLSPKFFWSKVLSYHLCISSTEFGVSDYNKFLFRVK